MSKGCYLGTMKRLVAAWLLTTAWIAAGAGFFVSPFGTPGGDGSAIRPWDLATALNHPASVLPGDTIWLRGGVYTRNKLWSIYRSRLTGAAGNPITVKQYPGERVIVEGSLFQSVGGWVNYWGFEIRNSLGVHYTSETGPFPTAFQPYLNGAAVDMCVSGIDLRAPNIKLINLIVHDHVGGGIGVSVLARNTEISGCLVYYNGWQGTDRAHGHGLYAQSADPGTATIRDSIFYGNYALGLQSTGSGDSPTTDNLVIQGNTIYLNGILAWSHQQNFLLGAFTGAAKNPVVLNNVVHDTQGTSSDTYLGYTGGMLNPVIMSNYFGTSVRFTGYRPNMVLSGNTFLGGTENLVSANYPNNDYSTARPARNFVQVRPNPYEPGRATISVFNWENLSSVPVELSGVLSAGSAYEVRNAQDFFAPPVHSGIFQGSAAVHRSAYANGALLDGANSVFVSGQHAFVTSFYSDRLTIFDVSDPANPSLVGSLANGQGGALLDGPNSVVVVGNHAYVASYRSSALEIVDVSNPAAPVHRGSLSDGAGGARLGGAASVFVDGTHAYVASAAGHALEIVDITNPAVPFHKGSLGNGEGGAVLGGAFSVYVSGTRAYVAASGSHALEIIDVSNPAAPTHLAAVADGEGGALLRQPYAVVVSGNHAYVGSSLANALEIIDVSNPAAPFHKGSLADGVGGAKLNHARSISIVGNYAYVVGNGADALEIVDISNPAAPVHKGMVAQGSGGALLDDPYSVVVSGNHAYVASANSFALEIIDVTGVASAATDGLIQVPMTALTVAKPAGASAPPTTAPNFAAFVVVPSGSVGSVGNNTAPTISSIPSQNMDDSTVSSPIPLTLGDAETPPGELVVFAISSNPALLPAAGIVFAGSGADRTMTLQPAMDQSGSVIVTVTVTDGTNQAQSAFTVNVAYVNRPPEISSLGPLKLDVNTTSAARPFTVGDLESPPDSLLVTARSSDLNLLPLSGITLGGNGSARTVRISPQANRSGTCTVTLEVSDGQDTTTTSFVVTVNSPPTITGPGDQNLQENTISGALAIMLNDFDTALDGLILTAASSNPTLLPTANITFGGSGAARSVTVQPAANQFGNATVTLTVSDGIDTAQSSFLIVVTHVNRAPQISQIGAVTLTPSAVSGPIPFTVSDLETAATSLMVVARSSNLGLLPLTGIVLAGTGSNRTVTLQPQVGQYGASTVTLEVSDGLITTPMSFELTVPPPPPPNLTLGLRANLTFDELSGATCADASGNGNTGTLSTGYYWAPSPSRITGKVGARALYFNGPDSFGYGLGDYVALATSGQLDVGAGSFTLCCWVKTTTTTDVVLMGKYGNAGTESGYLLMMDGRSNGGRLRLRIRDGSSPAAAKVLLGTESVNNGAWRHVAVVVDRTASWTAFYVDGVLSSYSYTNNSGNLTVPVTFSVGRANGGHGGYFVGAIDDLRVYDRALSSAEAAALASGGGAPVNSAPTISAISSQVMAEDTVSAAIPFTIGDLETPANSLLVEASSSDAVLFPASGLVLGGAGANRSITLQPAAGRYGTATIVVTVNDGSKQSQASFMVEVTHGNRPPQISSLAPLKLDVNVSSGALPFTVSDLESPPESLLVIARSSNLSLLPLAGIALGGSGSARTVRISPEAGLSGSATVTLEVTDGQATNSTSFVVTVNSPPTISSIGDQTLQENMVSSALAFTVNDLETSLNSLVVSGTSSNPGLIPVANITFGGSGAARTVTLRPAPEQSGNANITLSVSDGIDTAQSSFLLVVTHVNRPPQISPISDVTLAVNAVSGAIPFVISDAETAAASLVVSAQSSNEGLLPLSGIMLGGSGAARTITLSPLPGQSGAATVTLQITDGQASAETSFLVTVQPLPPTDLGMGLMANLTFDEASGIICADATGNGNTGTLVTGYYWAPSPSRVPGKVGERAMFFNGLDSYGYGLGDYVKLATTGQLELGAGSFSLCVWVRTTTATDVILMSKYANSGGESGYLLAMDGRSNGGRLRLRLKDGSTLNSSAKVFKGTQPINDGNWHHVAVVLDRSAAWTAFYLDGVLSSYASGDNSGNLNAAALFSIGRANGVHGSWFLGTIDDVRIYNRALSSEEVSLLFSATGSPPPNSTPTISAIGNQVMAENTISAPVSFTIGDAETPAGSLIVGASSSDAALLPASGLMLGGSGSNRSIAFQPASGRFGTATVVVTVSDGAKQAQSSFTVEVTHANQPPQISSLPPLTLSVDTSSSPLAFTVSDLETPPASLTVSALSSDFGLLPLSGIVVSGTGTGRTVTVTPQPGRSGSATVTLQVTDGQASAETTFGVTVQTLPPPPPPNLVLGLMTSLPFEEASGNTCLDASGNGNAGTLVTGYYWAPSPSRIAGKVGARAMYFNGPDNFGYGLGDYVKLSTAAQLEMGTGSFTLCGWVKTTTATDVVLMSKYVTSGAESGYLLTMDGRANGGRLRLRISDGNNNPASLGPKVFKGTQPINDGSWHHVAAVVDRGASWTAFYVDGVLSSYSSSDNSGNLNAPTVFSIGRAIGVHGSWLVGAMDDVRVYNRALSPGEVGIVAGYR